jgi:cell division protein FtsZ
MFELVENTNENAVIKVVGVGGGGGNAVSHMVTSDVEGVEFICANTDAQALGRMTASSVLHIGGDMTKGLGAGANPDVGRSAAQSDREQIANSLRGADMVFITAGMGGGTGTGAAPIVAEVAKELGILTVAVVTKPFPFEGKKRMKIAEEGIRELQEQVDSLIIIPNEKLLPVLGKNTSLIKAFGEANDVLKGAVQGIADLIIRPGMINVDFADVRTVMSEMGMAMMGTGFARGDERAREATEAAIKSPLLEDVDLKGASGILVNITAGMDLSLGEFAEVGEIVEEYASENATIVVGTVIDPDMTEELKVTVVATGLAKAQQMESGARVVNSDVTTGSPQVEVRTAPTPAPSDFSQLELPTVIRNRQAQQAQMAQEEEVVVHKKTGTDDMEFLDIPAFLRRQAD